MTAVTLKDAKRNDNSSWRETAYLLSNRANAEHLERSIVEAKAGLIQERQLLDA